MRVLFIGGTGIISSACTRLAAERGLELYVLNRGQSWRPIPDEVTRLMGDIRDSESARAAIGTLDFDAVVDWVAFTPEQVETDLTRRRRPSCR
jgi:nucleoside-diphosphate-sugar epimerase